MAFFWKKHVNSIRFKVMVILGITVIIFFLGYWVFFKLLAKKNELFQEIQSQELVQSVNAILETRNDAYGRMVYDYSVFSWMIDFIKNPSKEEGEMTISHPQNIGISFIQIYNLDYKLAYSDLAPVWKKPFSIPEGVFDSLYIKRKCNFFIKVPDGYLQVFGSTVHPSGDVNQETSPRGFIFFGKHWDRKYLESLEKITNARIKLSDSSKTFSSSGGNNVTIPLKYYNNEPAGYLDIFRIDSFWENINALNTYLNILFIVFCLVLFIISYFTYQKLVLGPLTVIQTALNTESTAPIQKLIKSSNNFGEVARLISWSFAQREVLKEKIKELNTAQEALSGMNAELIQQKQEIEEQNIRLHFLNDEMQAQNEEIVAIAEGLHDANKEITDSISYASFIQNAVLAPSHELSKIFTEHFIFFKPKNIVSGDFYWFRAMRNGDRILAVADCTGHGLSGSLLSMLGISYLNQIVSQLENETYSAATILDSLKYYFIHSMHQKEDVDYVQDGMHIALCIFSKDGKKMHYASAFHPIYMIRKNAETGQPELIELKGNRIPVGIYITNEAFENYEVDIQSGDVIYMFSDGIVDQFGGPDNKKYMSVKLRKFLLSVSQLPIGEQRVRLNDEFESWKGNNEQTDDVIVVGIRVPEC